MDRINTASKAVDLFGVGKHGWKNRNVATGVEPTDFNAEWCNGVQEEDMAIIEGAGIVPDGAVRNQVRQAIKRMAGGNVTTVNFAASPFALTADHAGLVLVDAAAGNVVINFPAANIFAALPYRFKRVDATANTVTFNRAGADTIDSAASVTLVGKDAVVTFVGDGVSTWRTVATPRGLARFMANGTFFVPPGVTTVYVSGVAGGGGGGGGGRRPTTTEFAGGGGGGGAGQAIERVPFTVTPGASIAITVGAGGAGGATNAGANGSAGTAGGNTVIGALVTLTSGGGGFGGGLAGGASPGAGYPAGSFGTDGSATTSGAGTGSGGVGASAPFGGGGGLGRSDVNASAGGFAGGAAGGFGAGGGGGGCGTNGVGGAGAPGLVVIEW